MNNSFICLNNDFISYTFKILNISKFFLLNLIENVWNINLYNLIGGSTCKRYSSYV